MKEEINLLPPAVSALRRGRIYVNRLGRLIYIALALTVIMLAALGVQYGLSSYIRKSLTAAESALAPDETAAAEVQAINTLTASVDNWTKTHQPLSPLVAQVLNSAPAGIVITAVAVDQPEDKITISGTFSERSRVAQYQQDIENVPAVARLEAPLSNFATGASSSFTFEIYRQDQTP